MCKYTISDFKHRLLVLLLLNFFFTFIMIQIHTPKLPELMFNFSCPTNSAPPCQAQVNQEKAVEFEQGVNNVVRLSRRLGKLSEIYMSVIHFHVHMENRTDMYLSISSPNQYVPFHSDATCGDIDLKYAESLRLDGDFILSDSPSNLFNKSAIFFLNCKYHFVGPVLPESKNPIIANTNAIVKIDIGPKFKPTLVADIWSWLIVFLFNLLILIGLLPIIREASKFLNKGKLYFR